jgi:hypothetical protein
MRYQQDLQKHMTRDIAGTASGPQAPDWGGLSWSEWHDFDEAHRGDLIPATPGLYRFRTRDEPGLLYIGESGAAGVGAHAWTIWRGGASGTRPTSISTGGRLALPGARIAVTMPLRTSASARTMGAVSRSRGRWKITRNRLSGGLWRRG